MSILINTCWYQYLERGTVLKCHCDCMKSDNTVSIRILTQPIVFGCSCFFGTGLVFRSFAVSFVICLGVLWKQRRGRCWFETVYKAKYLLDSDKPFLIVQFSNNTTIHMIFRTSAKSVKQLKYVSNWVAVPLYIVFTSVGGYTCIHCLFELFSYLLVYRPLVFVGTTRGTTLVIWEAQPMVIYQFVATIWLQELDIATRM